MEEETSTRMKMKAVVKGIYSIWIGERPGPLAASLAYYALFSMVPVTYLAFVIAGVFVDASALVTRLAEELEELLGPEALEQFSSALEAFANSAAKGSTIGSLISFIVIIFSASLIFFQLQYVLNNVWKAPPPSRGETSNYIRNRLLAFVMVLSVGLVLVVATVINLLISMVSILPEFEGVLFLANLFVFGLLVTMALAMIYKYLPNVEIAWKDVWVGSAVTAALLIVAFQLFAIVLSANRFNSALQAAGAVALFLISFYFFGTIFIVGAVFTRVYSEVFGSHIGVEQAAVVTSEADE